MNAVAALCVAQTALVAARLVDRSRRRRAEHALPMSGAARGSIDSEAQTLADCLVLSHERNPAASRATCTTT